MEEWLMVAATGSMASSWGATLFDKLWDEHVVADLGNGLALLHVDRHILHDLGGMKGLAALRQRGLGVRNPELTAATVDHAVSTAPGRTDSTNPPGAQLIRGLREETRRSGIRLYDIGDSGQGIVHVMGPELGLTQPGCLVVCSDSHTCTHGGLGALAWGIGRSELIHVLATQTIYQKKPRQMRVSFYGTLGPRVSAKDLILHLIGLVGASGGSGYALEYAGPTIRALPIEGRLTICNLSIELGAKFGIIAPDDRTFDYLADRPLAPKGEQWRDALAYWRSLSSDPDASFDREVEIDAGGIAPQITWGTSPQDVLPIDGRVPEPDRAADPERRKALAAALDYMGLVAGQKLAGTKIDWVFIGSCANSRLPDLRAAAALASGRKVAEHVRAWVVPGSQAVKEAAEAEGLDRVFSDAGFEWRESGCSMCLAANGETVPRGARAVSTSNRNFEGRQGPGARTHLASPATAAAAAIAGCIADPRLLGG
jgi:3-isopropylmalate/(R)-2-methylmalate dehydratase large subunit